MTIADAMLHPASVAFWERHVCCHPCWAEGRVPGVRELFHLTATFTDDGDDVTWRVTCHVCAVSIFHVITDRASRDRFRAAARQPAVLSRTQGQDDD